MLNILELMEDSMYNFLYEDDLDNAIRKFERMKKDNENYFFDVFEFEGIIDYYIESNNSSRAFEAALLASEQHPNSVSLQIRKARVLLDKGRAVEALRILKTLENIEPGNHEIYVAKGTAMAMLGDIQGAKKMFDFALSLDSDDTVIILYSITSVLQNLNYYEYLIPYMKRLVELESDDDDHLYDLAYAYEKIEDYDNSISLYLKYLELEPFSDSAWYNLAIIYNRREEYDKAIEAYDYALAINSQNTFALFNKGNILCLQDKYEEAIPVYLEYLENEPDNYEAMNNLAECYTRTGNLVLARKYLNDTIELAPDSPYPWYGLGVISLSSGNPDESIIYLRKAVRLDDEDPEIWYMLGKAHYARKEIKDTIRCYCEALKLEAYFTLIWIELGKIILKDGLVPRALPFFEKAYKKLGDIPGINYLLASFYLNIGLAENALRHLSLALDADDEIFEYFHEIFPERLFTRKIKKLLQEYNLR